jgi:putative transcriptional regulator
MGGLYASIPSTVFDAQRPPTYDIYFRLGTLGLIHIPNVKKLRERLGLTQEAFAATYRIPIGTLRDWEQRRKLPDATARAYLTVIARDPGAVASLLAKAA